MSRDTPRRPSRITTPKPRKIAGRNSTSDEPTGSARPPGSGQPPKPPVAKPPPPADDAEPTASALASPKATRILLVLIACFAVLLVLQGVWFLVHNRENDDRADAAWAAASESQEGDEDGPIPVPSGRPVILSQLAVQEGVEAAAGAAQIMFARDWESYDDGVDNAVTLMSEDFAKEYRATTDDVRQEFIAKKTEVQVRVVAQSVVRANDAELEALIFLNQYIFRGEGKDATNTYTPYRAVITMVHTDKGWLVDGLQTQ
jgi:Mce-associated membrane protein